MVYAEMVPEIESSNHDAFMNYEYTLKVTH